MIRENQKGITLIALAITIGVLIIISFISIASLTSDNGIIKQTNVAKVEKIEGDAREQVGIGLTTMNLAILEARARDNSYSAVANSSKIKAELIKTLNADKTGLDGEFSNAGTEEGNNATEIKIAYTGDDYKTACNNANAQIVYTLTLNQRAIELKGESSATLKDQNQNDVVVDVGGNTQNGSGTKLVEVASIGDYVNYDPTSGGNVAEDGSNITYTSEKGSTTSHGNGYGNRTFSASNYKNAGGKWRILNVEGETVTLISDPIYQDFGITMGTTGLYLSNGIGYIWAEEELHRIGAIYGHGEGADTSQTVTYYYGGPNDQDGSITAGTVEAQQGRKTTLSLSTPSGARALTVEDVNKICEKETTYTANYSSSTVTKVSDNATYYPTLSGTSTTGQSSAVDSPSGIYYYTYYSYKISSANTDATSQTKQNEMLIPGVNYWLGSRCVNANSSYADFNVRYVTSSGNVSGNSPCGCASGSWNSYSYSRAVRSVVTLKSGIQTSDATYNESTGWNIK